MRHLVIHHPGGHSSRSAHLAQWVQPQVGGALSLPACAVSALCCLAFIGAPGFHYLLRAIFDSDNQIAILPRIAYILVMR
jgi:hypothetical protein